MQDNTNTAFGWVLFSGIIALGLTSVSSRYFHSEPTDAGYPVEGGDVSGAVDDGPSLATLLATGDAAAGKSTFAKCVACHTIDQGGAGGIGPNLHGIMGQPIGKHAAGFAYSSALSGHGGDWTYENMDEWLKSPRAFASGTKMSFAGLSKGEDRANVMLYMRENGGGPPLPEPEPEPEAAADAEGEADAGEAVEGEAVDADADVAAATEETASE